MIGKAGSQNNPTVPGQYCMGCTVPCINPSGTDLPIQDAIRMDILHRQAPVITNDPQN